ncbi:hypothetical protein BLA60_20920 [Actinophytocola xinjiangensis]|uniref:Trypsin-like peptidase n=2 Tax=Actinophytocola xinjiangensis TaxID=485602 RepID=A0A7Z0WJV2_9PSEU|nr:hypothetical protein BLA60_20920 [Actinophytocola xinjiangensis]
MLLALAVAALAAGALTSVASASTSAGSAIAPAPAPAPKQAATKVGDEIAVSQALGYASADQQTISHPGATYIKVHFASMRLAPGDYVTVASPDGREVHTYHGDPALGAAEAGDADVTEHGTRGFAAMSVDGDTAVVTLHRTAARSASATKGLGLTIDRYWRGFTQDEVVAANPGLYSVCSSDGRRDVVCYRTSHPTEFTRSGAVARLLMGGGACTTWRVGNTNRLLTNNHCMSTQSAVAGSEVQFGYQCATCGGNNPGTVTKVSGATLVKTSTGGSGQLDYTLYSVNSFSTIQGFGTLFLETRAPSSGERIYIPGHGDASPKRLSLYQESGQTSYCTVGNGNYNTWNMSYSCDTSGGNSGSPVLASSSHRVIGLHHLGGCPNNQGAKMNLIYQQIQSLIDNG